MNRHTAWILVCAWVGLTLAPSAEADFVLSIEEVTVDPGGTVAVSVTLDNDDPIEAFQFGIVHNPAQLSAISIDPGPALSAMNGGDGADFLYTEIDPLGEPGSVAGALFSLSLPIETLPPGVGHELIEITYAGAVGIATATASPLDFTEELGEPDIEVVVAMGPVAVTPTQVSGEVVFNPTPIVDLACTPSGSCSLDYDLTWTNPTSYGSIRIFIDGVFDGSIIGIATSTSISFATEGVHEICLVGSFGTLDSPPACCTFTADPLPDAVADLSCIVDGDTCLGTITWTNTEPYTSIEIHHDGVLFETLAGTATSTTLLADETAITLCVIPINACGVGTSTCCNVACGVSFVRGDCNLDQGFDIADAISGLSILFGGAAPLQCDDACDANDDGGFDIADMIYILNALFAGGPNPEEPYPACGPDVTPDPLECTFGCP